MASDRPLADPGLVGRAIRLALATLFGWLAWGLLSDRASFWDGALELSNPFLWLLFAFALVGPAWAFSMAVNRPWTGRAAAVLVAGAAVAVLLGLVREGPELAPLGAYVWTLALATMVAFAIAYVLAAALGTPGCEMRAFAHLAHVAKGGRGLPAEHACPGYVDRFDHVRILGR